MQAITLQPDNIAAIPNRPIPRRRANGDSEIVAHTKRHHDAQLLDRIRTEHARSSAAPNPASRRVQTGRHPVSARSHPRAPAPQPCPEYQVLANRLFAYAVPLLKSLLRTGLIKKELLDRNLANGLTSDDYERLHTSIAARDALAITIVIAGEDYFRRTVIPRQKWDPDRGASLETYFMNGCLLNFAASVRSWRKEHPEWPTVRAASGEPSDTAADPHADAMMDAVENRDLIDRLAALAPPMVKTIMLLMLDGHSFAEIGQLLGISTRAVEGRLHRFRTQVKKDVRRGRLDLPLALAAAEAA